VDLQTTCEAAIEACSAAAPPWEVERNVRKAIMATVRRLMQRKPDIVVNAFEATETPDDLRKPSAATRRGLRRAAEQAAAETPVPGR
jgi:hypothetical protein